MATETTKGTDAAHGAADAAHGAADAAHSGGMPQLDFSTFPNQIFWLVVAIAAIYYILDRVALPRIAAVLAERNGTITNDIAAAEDLKQKAQEAENAYNKALSDARAEAQKIATTTRDEIKAVLDAAIERAEGEIAERTAESQTRIAGIRDTAMESVEAVAKDTAGAIAAALGRPADEAEIAAAVDRQMKGRSL